MRCAGRVEALIAVDTNVLLRYLLHDDPEQAPLADRLFGGAEEVLITDVVLVEAAWTLTGRKYGLSAQGLIGVVERLFGEPKVRFEDDQVVWRALEAYRSATAGQSASTSMGFADALVVGKAKWIAAAAGQTLNGVYTFDQAMQHLPDVSSP